MTLVTSQIDLVSALICLVTFTPATFESEIEKIPTSAKTMRTGDAKI